MVMSSGTAPNCGYMLPATEENFKKLKISLDKYYAYKEEDPEYELDDFLEECADTPLPLLSYVINDPVEVFVYRYNRDDGDIYDDLEDEVCFYLTFDEGDLYTGQTTELGSVLKEMKMFPEFSLWTVYG